MSATSTRPCVFYEKLFAVAPAKRRPGYANFVVAEPPLKLVLFENAAHAGTLNHLGVEVESTGEVAAATRRLAAQGLDTEVEEGVACCHALQDKVWVSGAGHAVGGVHRARRRADRHRVTSPLRAPPRRKPAACVDLCAPAPQGNR